MQTAIELKQTEPQFALYATVQCKQTAIGENIMVGIPHVQSVAQDQIAGPPFVRYTEWTDDSCTMEIGFPVQRAMESVGDIKAGMLGGTLTAYTLYTGPYDQLTKIHELVMDWIKEQKLEYAGACWESYLSPPDITDPAAQQTGIYWPVLKP